MDQSPSYGGKGPVLNKIILFVGLWQKIFYDALLIALIARFQTKSSDNFNMGQPGVFFALVFCIFYWDCNGRTNCWPLQKNQKQSRTIVQDFIPEKETLGGNNSKWLGRKLRYDDDVMDTLQNNVFCSNLFSFVPEKPHVDPEKYCFWDGMNLSRWVYVELLWS